MTGASKAAPPAERKHVVSSGVQIIRIGESYRVVDAGETLTIEQRGYDATGVPKWDPAPRVRGGFFKLPALMVLAMVREISAAREDDPAGQTNGSAPRTGSDDDLDLHMATFAREGAAKEEEREETLSMKRLIAIGVLALALWTPVVGTLEARGRRQSPRARATTSLVFWVPMSETLRQIFHWLLFQPNPCIDIPQNRNRPSWCPPGAFGAR